MSDRKIGMKSARPALTAPRTFAPTKNDTERIRAATSGATKQSVPWV